MSVAELAKSNTRLPERIRAALGLNPSVPHYAIYRHRLVMRISHWVNAVCLVILLMSGLNIFNAHPALYLGNASDFAHPLLMLSSTSDNSGDVIKGVTWIGSHSIDTTGVLGASKEDGQLVARGFPQWATLPGASWLAMARQWHFAFAWLLVINAAVFIVYSIWTSHFTRDLLPTGKDLRHLGREILEHAHFRFHHGESARHYNSLQKIAYCLVIFLLGPLIVLTGLTMSPTMDAAFPVLPWLFGGRQTARTLHFVCAFSFVGFFLVHIAMVVLSGAWNNLRSMITGWYVIQTGDNHD